MDNPLQGSMDWRKRKQMIEELRSADQKELPGRLLKIIRENHRNLGALNAALQLLSTLREDVVPGLLTLLEDADPEVRAYALIALAEQKAPQTIPAIIRKVSDSDPNVRFNAVEALGVLQAFEAVDVLVSILRERDFYLGFAAIEALVKIGAPEIVDEVSDLLADEVLGPSAVEALGKLGGLSTIPLILDWLDSPIGEAEPAVIALHELHRRHAGQSSSQMVVPISVAERMSLEGRRKVLQALEQRMKKSVGGYYPVVLPVLIEVSGWLLSQAQGGRDSQANVEFLNTLRKYLIHLLNVPELRNIALDAIKQIGNDAIPSLVAKLKDEDKETRRAALAALGSIGDPTTVPVLIHALETEEDDLPAVAAGALGKIGDRSAFEPLCRQLDHPVTLVRQTVVAAINSLGHPQHTQRMLELARHENPLVREAAIRSLVYFGDPQGLDVVIEACQDPSAAVRQAAVESVSLYDDERVFTVIQTGLRDEMPAIRAAAARALRFTPASFAVPLLQQSILDSDMWVRVHVCRTIAQFRGPEVENALLKLAHDKMAPVRAAAAKALGAFGSANGIKVLKGLLEDPEIEVVSSALEGLAATRQPAAVHLLWKMTAHPSEMIRRLAVTGLGLVGSGEAVQFLSQLMQSGAMIEPAMQALVQARTSESVQAIVQSLNQPETRKAAIQAASQLGEAALPAIQALLDQPDCGFETRLAITQVLQSGHHPRGTDLLIRMLTDPAVQVRLAAIYALSEVGSPVAYQAIQQLILTDPDEQIQRRARLVLRRIF